MVVFGDTESYFVILYSMDYRIIFNLPHDTATSNTHNQPHLITSSSHPIPLHRITSHQIIIYYISTSHVNTLHVSYYIHYFTKGNIKQITSHQMTWHDTALHHITRHDN